MIVWNDILYKIHLTNVALQKENINLSVVVNLLNSLEKYLVDTREKFFEYLDKTKKFVGIKDISQNNQRKRTRSVKITRFQGAAADTAFNEEDGLKINIFYPIIDCLCLNIKKTQSGL